MEDEPIHCIQSLEEIESLGLKKGSKVFLPSVVRILIDVDLLEEQVRRDKGKLSCTLVTALRNALFLNADFCATNPERL